MRKLGLIIQREYLTRVKKKSFIFATIAVPLGFLLIPVIVMLIASSSLVPVIGVIDRSGLFVHQLKSTDNLSFVFIDDSLDSAKAGMLTGEGAVEGILYIPPVDLDRVKGIQYYSMKSLSLQSQKILQREIDRILENHKLLKSGLSEDLFKKLKSSAPIETIMMTESGERSDSKFIAYGIAYIMGMVMYIAILIYGVMVMNGVVEEKSNRIMEVLVSSVRPTELLFGKITGIGLVGLTQLVIWALIAAVSLGVTSGLASESFSGTTTSMSSQESEQMLTALKNIGEVDFTGLLLGFIVFFLGGYFLYAALYAAVASAVNDSGDIQSLSLPVTIPVIFAFIVMNVAINDPHGPLAFWCSMIPFTSPIVMMGRIPFGVPWWELALSVLLLAAGFAGAVWMAAKIYRTGILMYGKKPSFRELFRWILHRN